MDVIFLVNAYHRTKKSKAAGVDEVTYEEYERDLTDNLQALHGRLRSGQYRAQPVKRVWLDKPDGGKRPLGIPVLEDKIVQRAVLMLLEQIYEADFYEFSYGFRPGRSPQQALRELRRQCNANNIQWIIDADVSAYFDTIDHSHLRSVLQQRMNDGGLMRLIGKWLNAGVMDDGVFQRSETGSPQGGVISPLLANVYLHYVLDDWFVRVYNPACGVGSF